MLKITRLLHGDTAHLILSGRIGPEQLADLRRCLEAEHASDVVLDLTEVNLVDAAVVRFLSRCAAHGVRLLGCPAYVREWMALERGPE